MYCTSTGSESQGNRLISQFSHLRMWKCEFGYIYQNNELQTRNRTMDACKYACMYTYLCACMHVCLVETFTCRRQESNLLWPHGNRSFASEAILKYLKVPTEYKCMHNYIVKCPKMAALSVNSAVYLYKFKWLE